MVKRRSQRPLHSGRQCDLGFSKEELHIIPQLLLLLRSGALSFLIPDATSVSTGIIPASPTSKVEETSQLRPSTNVLPATEWKEVKAKKSPSKFITESPEMLDSEGWSVPVRAKISDLRMGAPGICLASVAETKQLRKEMKAGFPNAVLCPINIDGEGYEMSVFTTDKHGRSQTRVRYMFQFGPVPVVFRSSAPMVRVKSDCSKIVLALFRERMDSAKWDYALRRGRSAVRLWMKERAQVDALDIGPATRPL